MINLCYINQFDFEYKNYLIEYSKNIIDKGILELVEAINSIDVLCTMNSCQGKLVEDEEDEHCPLTYVDFFVLYHQYQVAHDLFRILVHKFGGLIDCRVSYEADINHISDDEVEDNGLINMRFRIEMMYPEEILEGGINVYNRLVDEVKEFSKNLKLKGN